MSDETVNVTTKGLDMILKALKAKSAVRVGILSNSPRSPVEGQNKTLDNATLGSWHEFGTSKMPKRSFLRDPIADNLDKRLTSTGALDEDVLKDVVKQGAMVPFLKKIGIVAEGIIAEAFASNGFGKWAPHSPGYENNTGNILVDTTQLRNSITSEVVG